MLAGQLDEKSGLFKICTLILHKQTGTSDTVETLNEEDVFDVQVSCCFHATKFSPYVRISIWQRP